MNKQKSQAIDSAALHENQSAGKRSAMEWDVAATRALEGKVAHNHGATADTAGYLPYREDDDEDGAPAFNLDLQRFIVGVWQRRYIALATVVIITTVMALLIGLAVSKNWQASTTLIKRSHQDRLTLAERDPFKSQDYSLATLLDTLKLPSSLELVREQAGLDVSLTTLARAIDVALGRDSTILNLKVTWSDPEKAAELANLVAQTFINRTRLLLRDDATSAFDYYTDQLEETRQSARYAAADVLVFRQTNGISNLDAETKVLLEEMSRLQSELNSRRAEVGALQVATERLVAALKDEPEQVITYTIYRSPLKSRLAEYDWELQEALSKYTTQNPKVIKLNERIGSLKQMISDNNDEAIPENTYTRNSKREEMELRLQLLADDIKLREAQADALDQTLTTMQDKVAMLSDHEKDYLLLQSRLDGILALEKELARRVDETRLVKQRNDASFDVVEPALVPMEALPSGRKLMAMAGLMLAMGSGLMLVLLLEWRDPLVRSARDVTDIVGGETCIEIPARLTASGAAIDQKQPTGQLANLYRSLSNDLDMSAGSNCRLPLAVISAGDGAGRSTVAANLVTTRLMKGQQVLLVDADLRQSAGPRPGEFFKLTPTQTGLYEHLTEGQPLTRQQDDSGALRYIAAHGKGIADDRGLLALGTRNLAKFLKPFQNERYTIVDMPPLAGMEVTLEMTGRLNHALLVVRSGNTRRDELKSTMAQLNKRGIKCIATILIDVPEERLESANLFGMQSKSGPHKFWSKATVG